MAWKIERQPFIATLPITAGTTAADFVSYGVVKFGSSAAKTYDIAGPVAGRPVYLMCTLATSSSVQKVRASTGGTIDFLSSAGAKEVLQFNNTGEAAMLIGASSSQFYVFSQQALATSTS